MCLCGCERYSPGGTKLWKGGLGVLSIGTVPPRACWTDGMRYIVKPINKISTEKRKKPSRPCSGASSHPLSSQSVKNLSRTEHEIKEKKRFIVLPKQSPNPWTTLPASTQTPKAISIPIKAISITTKSGHYQNQHQECKKCWENLQHQIQLISFQGFTRFPLKVIDLIVVKGMKFRQNSKYTIQTRPISYLFLI